MTGKIVLLASVSFLAAPSLCAQSPMAAGARAWPALAGPAATESAWRFRAERIATSDAGDEDGDEDSDEDDGDSEEDEDARRAEPWERRETAVGTGGRREG